MLAANIKVLLVIIIVISGISLSAYSLILNLGESNIRDIESEYFSVIDSRGNILMSPTTSLEGKNISNNEMQDQIGDNAQVNEHVQKVLSGQIATSVFEQAPGERINTGYPVVIGGEPVYFVFFVTPTSSIYSSINDALFTNRIWAENNAGKGAAFTFSLRLATP